MPRSPPSTPNIEGLPWDRIGGDPAVIRFLRRLTGGTSAALSTAIVVPDGLIVASSDPDDLPAGLDLAGRDFIHACPPGAPAVPTFIGEVMATPAAGRMRVPVARPRHGGSGRSDGGVLFTSFSPSYFETFFGQVAGTSGDAFTLVHQDGSVRARHPGPVTHPGERRAPDDPVFAGACDSGAVAFIRHGGCPAASSSPPYAGSAPIPCWLPTPSTPRRSAPPGSA